MKGTAAFQIVDHALTLLAGLDVEVYDGPVLSQDAPDCYVIIGARGWADDEDGAPWTTDSEWRALPLNSGNRTEDITIPCEITAWSGSAPWADLRTQASDAFDAVADALLSVAAWAPCPARLGPMTLTNVTISQTLADPGQAVSIEFDLTVRILL